MLSTGCGGNEDDALVADAGDTEVNEVNEFVWRSMNLWYYWQDRVASLSDTRFTTTTQLAGYLNEFDDPHQLFEALLFPEDNASMVVDNYIELENSFQGISVSFGYEYGLVRLNDDEDRILGFVEYVVPNSPASNAGLKRGHLFVEVNGSVLSGANFEDLLSQSSYTLGLAAIENDVVTTTGTTISLTAVQLVENPILVSEILDVEGIKVGYLVYNQFVYDNNYHIELNEVFGSFLEEGVTELVLDFRYNPGGAITSCQILSSMVYGAATASTIFVNYLFNDKVEGLFEPDAKFLTSLPIFDEEGEIERSESLNRLDLSRVFVLTSGTSSFTSELLIAGLSPYLEVIQIGEKTEGNNEGSITLYDSPDQGYTSNEAGHVNPNHTFALQPIVVKIANAVGSEFSNGLEPDFEVSELDYLAELKPLGDPEEAFLSEALAVILGTSRIASRPSIHGDLLFESRMNKKYLQKTLIDR